MTRKKKDKPLKITVLYKDALEAFLQTPPERKNPKKKAAKKRK